MCKATHDSRFEERSHQTWGWISAALSFPTLEALAERDPEARGCVSPEATQILLRWIPASALLPRKDSFQMSLPSCDSRSLRLSRPLFLPAGEKLVMQALERGAQQQVAGGHRQCNKPAAGEGERCKDQQRSADDAPADQPRQCWADILLASIGEPAQGSCDRAFIGLPASTTGASPASVTTPIATVSLLNRSIRMKLPSSALTAKGSIVMGVSIASVMEPMPFMASAAAGFFS